MDHPLQSISGQATGQSHCNAAGQPKPYLVGRVEEQKQVLKSYEKKN